MTHTRRDVVRMALATLPAAAMAAFSSKEGGVQIGTITYSFKNDVKKPDDIISDLVKIGINSVELMSNDGELMAGAPAIPNFGFGAKLTGEQQALVDEGRPESMSTFSATTWRQTSKTRRSITRSAWRGR
jgi:hypothetical protein